VSDSRKPEVAKGASTVSARPEVNEADEWRTAQRQFDIAAEIGMKICEQEITRHDVYIADECFLTGTAAELIPVIRADGRTIGNGQPGAITTRMIARFRELTRQTGTPVFP
jgi:branched-chain amino acid aminotransferase